MRPLLTLAMLLCAAIAVLAAPATLPDRQPASALASSAAGEAYNRKATMFQPYPQPSPVGRMKNSVTYTPRTASIDPESQRSLYSAAGMRQFGSLDWAERSNQRAGAWRQAPGTFVGGRPG